MFLNCYQGLFCQAWRFEAAISYISRYVPKNDEQINLFTLINKKPITPTANEINKNPPSRSAKLRYVIKKEDFYDFETDILNKFSNLIEIENFSKKL